MNSPQPQAPGSTLRYCSPSFRKNFSAFYHFAILVLLCFFPTVLTFLLKATTFPRLFLQPLLSGLVLVPWPGREVSPSGSVWENSFQIQASNSHGSCSVFHTFPSQSTKMLIPQNHFLPGFSQHHQAMLNLSRRIWVLIQTPFCPGGSLASFFILCVTS